jgi:two-component system CitB family sensor kinase
VQALTTILGNLIDNAVDALTGTPAPRRIEISVVESAQSVTVVVSDNGPGVDPTANERIFHNGYTTKRGSLVRHSGLGLSLVHNTVTKLGGSISVSEGPGATFTVVLPRTPAYSSGQRR